MKWHSICARSAKQNSCYSTNLAYDSPRSRRFISQATALRPHRASSPLARNVSLNSPTVATADIYFCYKQCIFPHSPRDLLCAIYFLCQDSIAAYFSQIRGGIGQLYCSSYICPRRPASLFGADNCIFFKYVCRQQADDSLLSCCNIQSSSFRTGLNVCRLDIQVKRRRWTTLCANMGCCHILQH